MSLDGQIVIAHDIETKRVFGESHNITNTDYSTVLSKLLTIREPRSKMPLLEDALKWCIKVNDLNHRTDRHVIKIMLDIKTDNDPEVLYTKIFELFKALNGVDYWKDKIYFGIWRYEFFIAEKLDGFSIINISYDYFVAKQFYQKLTQNHPGVKLHAISMINYIIYRKDECKEFICWLTENNLKLWLWTVNDNIELQKAYEFCSASGDEKLLEGVITDDPIKLINEESSQKSYTLKYRFCQFLKCAFYNLMLKLMRNKYNISYLLVFLKKAGFL